MRRDGTGRIGQGMTHGSGGSCRDVEPDGTIKDKDDFPMSVKEMVMDQMDALENLKVTEDPKVNYHLVEW